MSHLAYSLRLTETEANYLAKQDRNYVARKAWNNTWYVFDSVSDHYVTFDDKSLTEATDHHWDEHTQRYPR